MESEFFQLAFILAIACAFGFVILKLGLPLMVSYLLTGVALSTLAFSDVSILNALPEIGIAFVLFLIGMDMDWREIKLLGKPVAISAVVQIFISSAIGFGVAHAIGFVGPEALLIGIGLAFSSTVVIVKMLIEKRDLASLYGKLSVGMLIIEDIAAIIVLMFISIAGTGAGFGASELVPLLILIAKAIGLILTAFLLSRYVLDRLFHAVAGSVELLFFTAITWCFVFTSLTVWTGFSIVIGSFIAGVALASSPYQLQIQGKIKPLRDFFVALFFVYLGLQVQVAYLFDAWGAVLVLTALALVMNPLLYFLSLSRFQFRKHTVFQASINMSQISEFSLIILLVGVEFGFVSELGLSVVAGATVLSTIISSVVIARSEFLYRIFKPLLSWIQRAEGGHEPEIERGGALEGHVVLIGADRVGGRVVKYLTEARIPMIVLDYNPHIVKELSAEGVRIIYGDLSDPEILDSLQLETARLIISTASMLYDNQMLLEACKRKNTKATIVVRTAEPEHEQALKDLGADYVIMPEHVVADFIVQKLQNEWPNVRFSEHT